MAETNDIPDAPSRRRARARRWVPAAGMALLAVALGVHSARRLAAHAAFPLPAGALPETARGLDAELEAVRGAVARSPEKSDLRHREGVLLFLKGERLASTAREEERRRAWTEAVSSFQQALEADPLNAESHREIALALERLGETEQADRFAERGARLFPSHADLQHKLGLFFLERRALVRDGSRWALDVRGLEKALACFRRAARIDPAYLDTALEIVARTVPGLDTLDAMVPPTPGALKRYARFLYDRGDWTEAAAYEEKVIASGFDDAETRLQAGRARLMAGDLQPALKHFRRAFRSWRLGPSQVRRITEAFRGADRAESGAEFFLSLDLLQPEESMLVAKALGRLFLDLGRYGEAEEFFSEAAVEGSDPEAYHALAALAERAGDLYSAERHLKQAIRGKEDAPRYHRALGRILEKGGRTRDALREYKRASALDPDNEGIAEDVQRMRKRWNEGK